MNNSKHTKGEWKCAETGVIHADGKNIAFAEITNSNRKNDAKLISAAPDLLTIVQRLVANEEQYAGSANLIIEAKKAIKKATE